MRRGCVKRDVLTQPLLRDIIYDSYKNLIININKMNSTKGQPKGIYLLFVTEMWERFSYFGMRAILTLYMVQALLLDKELASQIYGSYTGMVYLTPLIGGYIADRYWGNRRSILTGATLMAIGQFTLFISASNLQNIPLAKFLMICGLVLLIIGNGFFKPNIATMVGSLYKENDKRKDSAYTIFYMGVNVGAIFAPLVCGYLGNTNRPEDFRWGFLAACIGILIGGIIFQTLNKRYLVSPEGNPIGTKPQPNVQEEKGNEAVRPGLRSYFNMRTISLIGSILLLTLSFAYDWKGNQGSPFGGADWIGSLIYATTIVVPIFIITDKTLTTSEKKHIGIIYAISFFVIFFWAAYEQAGVSLTFFADEQTNRMIGQWEMPSSYFQSFPAIMVVILAPVFVWLWTFLGRYGLDPNDFNKQAFGLLFLALGYWIIALGVKDVDYNVKVSMFWLISLYLLHTIGELCLSPIGLSIVNKLSPARFSSLLMGVWYLSSAAANKFAGMLSGFYPENGVSKNFLGYSIDNLHDFFMLFVFMSGITAIMMFLVAGKLNKMMK